MLFCICVIKFTAYTSKKDGVPIYKLSSDEIMKLIERDMKNNNDCKLSDHSPSVEFINKGTLYPPAKSHIEYKILGNFQNEDEFYDVMLYLKLIHYISPKVLLAFPFLLL